MGPPRRTDVHCHGITRHCLFSLAAQSLGMSLRNALFGFTSTAPLASGPNHHAAGLCLRISCWVTLVLSCLVALLGVAIGLAALFGGAFWHAAWEPFGGVPWGSGLVAGMIGFAIILSMTVIAVGLAMLYLWWNNQTYLHWVNRDEGALVWANVFAVVSLLLVVAPGGMPMWWRYSSSGEGTSTSFGIGTNMLTLVLSILIIVFANLANSRGELSHAATPMA